MTWTNVSRAGPVVSHLLFTDDSFIFDETKIANTENLQEILREYEVYLGQMLKFDKFLIYFSLNVNEAT